MCIKVETDVAKYSSVSAPQQEFQYDTLNITYVVHCLQVAD